MLLQLAQAGDTIITLEVSRLSRSTQQLCELIDIIREKRLRLVIMGSITIDCREGKADPIYCFGNRFTIERDQPIVELILNATVFVDPDTIRILVLFWVRKLEEFTCFWIKVALFDRGLYD